MNPDTWRQVSAVFSDCLQRSAVGRELLLSSLESSQPEVVREVRELLATYEKDREFLESPAVEHLTDAEFTADHKVQEPQPALSRSFWSWLKGRPAPFRLMAAAELVALIFCVGIVVLLARYGGTTVRLGWDCDLAGNEWRVNKIDTPGPATGILEIGDVVRAFNNSPVHGSAMIRALNSLVPGAPYSMRILRSGAERDVVLSTQIVHGHLRVTSVAAYLVVSFAFLIAAVVVGALKPAERITQLAWAALITEALTLLGVLMSPYQAFLAGPARILQTLELVDGPHFALAYHFYTRLFARDPRRRHVSIIIFYVVGISIPFIRLGVWSIPDPYVLTGVIVAESAYYVLAPLAICAAVLRNYLTVKEPDAHRRLRWVVFGSLAGICPYALIRTFGIALPLMDVRPAVLSAYELTLSLAIIPAALIPFATGYAILKHRLFDIDVVVRRGLQYLLAKNILRLVISLPAAGLLYALITNAHRTVADVVFHNGVFIGAVVLIAIVLMYRERLSRWLDRKFFRESYRQERLLMMLIDNVKKLDSAPGMCKYVGEQVMAALHPESIAVFYRCWGERAFLSGFSSDERSKAVRVLDTSPLISTLQLGAEPEDMTCLRRRFGDAQGRRWLDRLGVDLIVPILQVDRTLTGFVLLGRKKSDEPYTSSDRSLLAAVAEQMGIVSENLSLQDQLHRQRESSRQMHAQAANAGARWMQECPACGRCFDPADRRCPDDGSELVSSLPVPRMVDGRYRLDRAIGKGGMGVVYRAMDMRLKRDVAVKLILPGKLGDAAALKRFVREAHALARVSHPNIVATHDFGVIEGEVAWMVMEFVPCSTLRAEISGRAIRASFAPHWLGQLLDGVQAAHEAGIVHRDLKPENVLVSHPIQEASQLKIADFGIARWSAPDLADSTLTVPGTLLGSMHYMSPEQLTGDAVDARTDIFSAGVIIFEVLVGRIPFSGKSPAERIASILNDDKRLESALPGAAGLQRVLDRCLARDPMQRYDSAAELKKDLIPLLASSRGATAR